MYNKHILVKRDHTVTETPVTRLRTGGGGGGGAGYPNSNGGSWWSNWL